MNTVNKQVIFTVVIAVVIIGLLLFAFRSCNPVKSYKPEGREVYEVIKEVNKSDDRFKDFKDSVLKELAVKDKRIEQLEAEKAVTGKKLNVVQAKVQDLVVKGTQLKIEHDTVGYVINCDSLSYQVTQQEGVIDHYESLVDTLLAQKDAVEQAHIAYEQRQTELNTDLKTNFDNLGKMYQTQNKDYKKLRRNFKIQRTVGRLTAIGSALFILKMIVK